MLSWHCFQRSRFSDCGCAAVSISRVASSRTSSVRPTDWSYITEGWDFWGFSRISSLIRQRTVINQANREFIYWRLCLNWISCIWFLGTYWFSQSSRIDRSSPQSIHPLKSCRPRRSWRQYRSNLGHLCVRATLEIRWSLRRIRHRSHQKNYLITARQENQNKPSMI